MSNRSTYPTRRQALSALSVGGVSLLAGCNWDGHFDLLGYTTRPNYDPTIKTVYVPTFRNKAFQWTPFRGMERQLTLAVIQQLEWRSTFRSCSDPGKADTELLGTVITIGKNLLNRTQENEVRDGEVVVAVELVWRDNRSGKILSNPRKPTGAVPPTELPVFDQDNRPLREGPEKPVPVVVQFNGRYLPEVGETTATAQQRVCTQLARQIVRMMESDWELPPKAPT